ncbi:MAG TPA: maltose alpha-D-glucosyltransferase [Thermohalobaculum sp.]|nr:maltose alpha-D-glucosyltransferase [Thermohalobaculum sp.]
MKDELETPESGAGQVDRSQADWYKDAIIYQLHIKAFNDADNDGIGDFKGLMERLDYVEELGVNVIWLLPFYPSPLRDDGYDIARYTAINPSYGTMRDFRRFVTESHKRGIRVVTELVINHTSDQHPWFQRARKAKPGTVARDFYVWSDTDDKYGGTRIIFLDTEKSNWSWDPEAEAFFWHRFYSHQPDLNFDNPAVLREVLKVMHFWLSTGVDGLRLDAIPYLVEREGTNNENLPETHEVLKKVRASLDEQYTDRMLLAEANQWPEDTRPYFGDGDECHMGFHFPLMPRMYMALAQEDRHPVTDILRQTPAIPENCQWAIFLRNHDELTLEMVTDKERDYLWQFYASDRRARINLGIRRRLAPLLGNDRRKIELMNGMLFSMPGTPVIYYGDEIGMGDNYYLGDRDGVRTPMQWSADRNGGFSRANPQALYLPTIQDPVYGYESINVEAQSANAGSLLNWMRRMIRIRKRQKAFGRGTLDFIYPRNRKILAYIRRCEDEVLLCVFNVSRSAQAVELDLAEYRTRVPVELEGGSAFPPIGDLPYMLTLPPYGFYWFQLVSEAEMPEWHQPMTEVQPEFDTLACRGTDVATVLTGEPLAWLGREVLPDFLPLQRWFGAKGERFTGSAVLPGPVIGDGFSLSIAEVKTADTGEQSYFMPLHPLWGEEHVQFGAPTLFATLARIRRHNRLGALIDAARESRFAEALVAAMRAGAEASAGGLTFRAEGNEGLAELEEVDEARALGVEQSNVSIAFGDKGMLKIYRRLRAGRQPDIEIGRFLTEHAKFANTPAFLGEATIQRDGAAEPATIAACFGFVPNQGDGWTALVDALSREIEDRSLTGEGVEPEKLDFPFPLDLSDVLGQRTGELHVAFATPTDDPAFAAEPITAEDIADWAADTRAQAEDAFRRISGAGKTEPVAALLARRDEAMALIERLGRIEPGGVKTRIHGDYHLGQVLVSKADIYIIDFEGEPRRTLEERRAKSSPLRDVAGMLRSFDYAAFAAVDRVRSLGEDTEDAEVIAGAWRDRSTARFGEAYAVAVATAPALGDGPSAELLRLFTLQKAFYEIGYEAANRPGWLSIPVRGVLSLLDEGAS